MCDMTEERLAALADDEATAKNSKGLQKDGICMKCKQEKAVVVVRVGDPMCRTCFLAYCTHKFRATLGKSRLIRADENVLLAVSGGHSSLCMLQLVKEALHESAHKRLRFHHPGIVHIDESCTVSDDNDDSSITTDLDERIAAYDYPYFRVPIYSGYASSKNDDSNDSNDSNDDDRDQAAFLCAWRAMESQTAREDFLASNRLMQIVNVARKHSYTKVMLAENSTSLSVKLFSNLAQGKGASVPLDMGVADTRYQDVTLVRPLREFSSKETALFIRHSSSVPDVSGVVNTRTRQPANVSLQRQAEEFILALQAGFPSTVSTVFRTADKLSMPTAYEESEEDCVLCAAPILIDGKALKTCGSVSRVSEEGGCCGSFDECLSTKSNRPIEGGDVIQFLCYACRLTFKDMNYDGAQLPQFVLNQLNQQLNRARLKSGIQEYLLDD